MKHRNLILLFAIIAMLLPVQAQQVRQPESITVTIAAGGSLSTPASLAGCTPAAILMPATWTAASIGFQATIDGTNYFKVWDSYGSRVSATVSTSRWVVIQPVDTWSFFSAKLESIDSSGNAVTQVQTAEIKLICRK